MSSTNSPKPILSFQSLRVSSGSRHQRGGLGLAPVPAGVAPQEVGEPRRAESSQRVGVGIASSQELQGGVVGQITNERSVPLWPQLLEIAVEPSHDCRPALHQIGAQLRGSSHGIGWPHPLGRPEPFRVQQRQTGQHPSSSDPTCTTWAP
jgi:hypothetical protein